MSRRSLPPSACRLALMIWALVPLALAPASGAAAGAGYFTSPSGKLLCQITAQQAWCDNRLAAGYRSATLLPSGTLKICGLACAGDPGDVKVSTLAYGRSRVAGPFRCTSLRAGVRCLVRATGRGFQISRAGVMRI